MYQVDSIYSMCVHILVAQHECLLHNTMEYIHGWFVGCLFFMAYQTLKVI